MTKNLGTVDRLFRGVVGIIILAAGYFYESWLGLIGAVPLLTALISWCPGYVPFGVSTCRNQSARSRAAQETNQ